MLLETSYADESYAAMHARWQNRKGERAERWRALSAELVRMEQAVRWALGDRQAQAAFFFRPMRANGSMSCASFLCERHYDAGYSSVAEARQALAAQTQAQRARSFLKELMGNEYEAEADGAEQLFRELVDCDLTDGQKQIIGQLFFRHEEYAEQLLSLIETAIEAMQPWKALIEAEVADCAQRWEAFLAQYDLQTWLNDRFQVALEDNPHGYVIVPAVTGCNCMGIHTGGGRAAREMPYTLRMGVLMDASGEDGAVDPSALCEVLKLLSDRSKMDILRILKEQRAYGGELARRMDLTTATISYHMQALINYNMVGVEKVNNRIYYTLNRRRIEELLDEARAVLLE